MYVSNSLFAIISMATVGTHDSHEGSNIRTATYPTAQLGVLCPPNSWRLGWTLACCFPIWNAVGRDKNYEWTFLRIKSYIKELYSLTLEIQACRLSERTCTVQRSADKPVCPVLQTCQAGLPNFDELPGVQSERERRENKEREWERWIEESASVSVKSKTKKHFEFTHRSNIFNLERMIYL